MSSKQKGGTYNKVLSFFVFIKKGDVQNEQIY